MNLKSIADKEVVLRTTFKKKPLELLAAIVLSNIWESNSQATSLVLQKSIKVNGLDMDCINFEIQKEASYHMHYTVIQNGKNEVNILK